MLLLFWRPQRWALQSGADGQASVSGHLDQTMRLGGEPSGSAEAVGYLTLHMEPLAQADGSAEVVGQAVLLMRHQATVVGVADVVGQAVLLMRHQALSEGSSNVSIDELLNRYDLFAEASIGSSLVALAHLNRLRRLYAQAEGVGSVMGQAVLSVAAMRAASSGFASVLEDFTFHAGLDVQVDGSSLVDVRELMIAYILHPGAVIGDAGLLATISRAYGLEPGPLAGESSVLVNLHRDRGLVALVLGHAFTSSDMRLNQSVRALVLGDSAVTVAAHRIRYYTALSRGFAKVSHSNIWTGPPIPVLLRINASAVGLSVSATGAI